MSIISIKNLEKRYDDNILPMNYQQRWLKKSAKEIHHEYIDGVNTIKAIV